MTDAVPTKEAEHESIATSLVLEQLDTNLFRSEPRYLHLPPGARGVFGGQVISQALLATTRTVDPSFAVHSLHSYFLLSANPSISILYYVELVRDGRTYATRSVKAIQSGRTVFILASSFQKLEPNQPFHRHPFPKDLIPPEQCYLAEEVSQRILDSGEEISERLKERIRVHIEDRKRSPIIIRFARTTTEDKESLITPNMFWMRAHGQVAQFDAPFQKCILAYMSDLYLIGTVNRTLRAEGKIKSSLNMTSSLDHSIWYYNHNFDCSTWLLFVMQSPRSGLGRGVVHGRVYTRDGSLIAVVTQEGVARVKDKIEKPDEARKGEVAKL